MSHSGNHPYLPHNVAGPSTSIAAGNVRGLLRNLWALGGMEVHPVCGNKVENGAKFRKYTRVLQGLNGFQKLKAAWLLDVGLTR